MSSESTFYSSETQGGANDVILVSEEQEQRQKRPMLRGIVFDLDGTLTVPVLDFKAMRERTGILQGDLLAVINSYEPNKREEAYRIIDEVEEEGRNKLAFQPGMFELLDYLATRELNLGIITRNSERSLAFFLETVYKNLLERKKKQQQQQQQQQAGASAITDDANTAAGDGSSTADHNKVFSVTLSREFLPPKPAPDSLLHIAKQWNMDPREIMMVGDSSDDMKCGRDANAYTCLLLERDTGAWVGAIDDDQVERKLQLIFGDFRPDFIVDKLIKIRNVIETHFTTLPKQQQQQQQQ